MQGYMVKIKAIDRNQSALERFGNGSEKNAEKEKRAFYYKQIDALRAGTLSSRVGGEIKHFEADFGTKYIRIVLMADKGLTDKLRAVISDSLKLPAQRVIVTSKGFKACVACERPLMDDDHTTDGKGKPLCHACMAYDESEPYSTVVYWDGHKATIGHYHNDTEGDFQANWEGEGYRGHYSVTCSAKWSLLHSDGILAMSNDANELKEFDDHLTEALKEKGIKWARVISRSSNLFFAPYDLFVEARRLKDVERIVKHLSSVYRDPVRYNVTALTGKDPKDCDDRDIAFASIASKILKDKEQ